MKTTTLKQGLILAILILSIVSCKKKNPEDVPEIKFEHGVYIVNEGPFGSGSGSISYFNTTTKTVFNDVFESANDFPLGNIVQSINIFNNKAYIVVNQANKIEVASASNFKSIGTIQNLSNPRSLIVVNNEKAYLTEWGSNGTGAYVKVINTQSNTVSKTIDLERSGAEKMLQIGDFVYVTCKGGYGKDSVVSIINTTTDTPVSNTKAGPSPEGIVLDANGNIWVLCIGEWKDDYSSLAKTGRLVMLNIEGTAIEKSFVFSSTFAQPSSLCISADKTILYYNYNGKVYAQNINSSSLDNTVITNRSFYGLDVDPRTGTIYAADPGNYSSEGKVIRYTPNGVAIDSFNVGVIPSSFFFQ